MQKNILITGAAKRIGAACATLLHRQGCNIILHYRESETQVRELCTLLNQQRPNSAQIIQADLLDFAALKQLADQATAIWGKIDGLVNNASAFYPTPLASVTEKTWDDLMGCNLKAPFFLSQALMETLGANNGCIINIIDIHAERGLKDYPIYSMAKSGLASMTRILAKELAPSIRVNGISPGAIIWPEDELSEAAKGDIMSRIALKRAGEPDDIAKMVAFFINDAPYITGQIINVDGGRTLFC
ncbi:MAG: pteridine reductase [Methylococcales bacterium]|nr:pteridine reductase [Methylococcales bacterium]